MDKCPTSRDRAWAGWLRLRLSLWAVACLAILMLSLSGCPPSRQSQVGDVQASKPDTVYCESFSLMQMRPIHPSKRRTAEHCVQVVYDGEDVRTVADGCYGRYMAAKRFSKVGNGYIEFQEVTLHWPPTTTCRIYVKDSIYELLLHLEPVGRKAMQHNSPYNLDRFEFDTLQFVPYIKYALLIMDDASTSLQFHGKGVPFQRSFFATPASFLALPWSRYAHTTYEPYGPVQYKKTIVAMAASDPDAAQESVECVELYHRLIGKVFLSSWWMADARVIDCPEQTGDK